MQDQCEYKKQYDDLHERYEAVKSKTAAISAVKQLRQGKRHNILQFIETIRQRDNLLENFDEPLFRTTVEKITVHSKSNVAITFKDGREITVDARLKKFEEYAEKAHNA